MISPDWDVVGIGENSIDEIYRLPELPGANAKIPIAGRRVSPGGQVATTMCACASLGLRASYVGAFGSDEHGTRVRATLSQWGVHTGDAFVKPAANRHAVILVDARSGERVVLWRRDAALTLDPRELRPATVTRTRVLHVDSTDAAFSLAAARAAREAGVRVTSDIDEATDLARELIEMVDVAILAEHVPRALTRIADVERAMRALRRQHAASICVTLGARGALLLENDRLYRSAAFQVKAVDTTGAGDIFRAGFICAMLRGEAPEDVLRFANAAAAVGCTREGAIDSVPSLEDVLGLLGGH